MLNLKKSMLKYPIYKCSGSIGIASMHELVIAKIKILLALWVLQKKLHKSSSRFHTRFSSQTKLFLVLRNITIPHFSASAIFTV